LGNAAEPLAQIVLVILVVLVVESVGAIPYMH